MISIHPSLSILQRLQHGSFIDCAGIFVIYLPSFFILRLYKNQVDNRVLISEWSHEANAKSKSQNNHRVEICGVSTGLPSAQGGFHHSLHHSICFEPDSLAPGDSCGLDAVGITHYHGASQSLCCCRTRLQGNAHSSLPTGPGPWLSG